MSGCPTTDELLEAAGEYLAALAGRVDPADAIFAPGRKDPCCLTAVYRAKMNA